MKIVKFKEGDTLPLGAVFLYASDQTSSPYFSEDGKMYVANTV